MIELTEKQINALPHIEWLISDEPYGGRSFTLAIAYINKAIQNSNFIIVRDHYPNRMCDSNLLKMIKSIIESHYLDYSIIINEMNNSFKLKRRENEGE